MKKEIEICVFLNLELDSDFDSRDGSDNENENVGKYEVSNDENEIINIYIHFCRQIRFHHHHHLQLVHHHLDQQIFDIEAIVVVMFV